MRIGVVMRRNGEMRRTGVMRRIMVVIGINYFVPKFSGAISWDSKSSAI